MMTWPNDLSSSDRAINSAGQWVDDQFCLLFTASVSSAMASLDVSAPTTYGSHNFQEEWFEEAMLKHQ